MRVWLRLRWQQITQHPRMTAVIIVAGMLGIALLVVLVLGYIFNWGWTGLGSYIPPIKDSNFQRGKTLWDWMQLLIIPFVLAITALLFNLANTRTEQRIAAKRYKQEQHIAAQRYEQDKDIASRHYHQDQLIARQRYEQDRRIALDKQREDLLQTYLDRMSELLLEKQLRTSDTNAEVRNVARVRTISVLFQLDARRIGYVFAFLRETGLMSEEPNSGIISLSGANLSMIDLSQTNLDSVNLSGANLRGANLSNTNLSFSNLSEASFLEANLSGVNLMNAYLVRAKFSGADLSNANLSDTNLSQADFADFKSKKMNGADFIDTTLSGANLCGVNLSKANLRDARVTPEQLNTAKSLKGATMPDGSKYP